MNKPSRVTYTENFALDLSSDDCLLCDGIVADNKVLRGVNVMQSIDARTDYKGIVGASSKYLFVHTNKVFRRYDGTEFKNLSIKMPVINPESIDARYDIYRDKAYLAFDQDGVIKYDDENVTSQLAERWAFNDAVEAVAVVNERVAVLTKNGTRLRFAPCNQRLYSEGEQGYVMPSVDFPCSVQAIKRLDYNTLYALGSNCYKVTFSADETDIKFKTVASGLGKVIMHSVVVLGGKIIFATENGLYALHNDAVTPIFPELNKAVRSYEGSRANAWRGKYVLSVPFNQGRVVYVLDVSRSKCEAMLNRDIFDIHQFNGRDCAVNVNGELVAAVDGVFRPSVFVRSGIDFKCNENKFLRKMYIAAKYDVDVFITDGFGEKRLYRVKGGDKSQSVNIFGKGKAFTVEIRSRGKMEVTEFSLVAETYKEEYYGS